MASIVTVSEESPLIPLIVTAPPLLLIVRSDVLARSIVPVLKEIAFPAVVVPVPAATSCPIVRIVTAAPAVKSITSPVSLAVMVTVSLAPVTFSNL